ncbi:MAG TPA: TIGR03118 family protein [Bryobacteraceae bacterium]|nr:TIGR03118 family protein [Bryobacteraceae bacterium]
MRHNVGVLLLSMLFLAPASLSAQGGYLVYNLIADQAGVADLTDPNLVNPWGISITASSPFWVCDGGTGLSTVYTFSATTLSISSTKAAIPPATSGGNKTCTGIVSNATTTAFEVGTTTPAHASFLFATLGGTISGWASSVSATQAQMAIDNSGSGASYDGLALYTPSSSASAGAAPRLYAPNFTSGAIEVYDVNFKPVTLATGAFTDPKIPAGYAPFNIQYLGGTTAVEGKLYVTYAQQDPTKKLAVAGAGNGYVDVYDTNGNLLQSLIAGGNLNAPWGLALAMSFPTTATGTVTNLNFGQYSGDLLVGNFGDGKINAYNPTTGALVGQLTDQNSNPIQISGLWALQFGNGGSGGDPNTLFFTAGTAGETHGLFGSIETSPTVTASNIVNGASFGPGIAPNTWITITGSSLAATARSWEAGDFSGSSLPTVLDGVTVTINGEDAYPSFISPKQINILTPSDMPVASPVQIVVTNNKLTSSTASVTTASVAPAFFAFSGGNVAATHLSGAYIGPTTLGTAYTPAAPGETIVLYGTGFGTTNPSIVNGKVVSGTVTLANTATIQIGGQNATVVFAGLTPSSAGLYQFNVTVPAGLAAGTYAVTASVNGVNSPTTGVSLAVQ